MWKAIIWFQGENDSFDQAEAEGYLEELTKFISNLREEMFKVDVTAFSKPSDIPVVIVGLGCWIARDGPFGKIVSDARRDYLASTDSAVFVHTDDLSCHYHFDDASQLIIGERLGKAMENFLVTPATNPSTLSSKKPTYRPTKAPLTSLSTQIVEASCRPQPSFRTCTQRIVLHHVHTYVIPHTGTEVHDLFQEACQNPHSQTTTNSNYNMILSIHCRKKCDTFLGTTLVENRLLI
jgi:hypothetical protein